MKFCNDVMYILHAFNDIGRFTNKMKLVYRHYNIETKYRKHFNDKFCRPSMLNSSI